MAEPTDKDALIAQFCSVTQESGPELAEMMLKANNWDVESAVSFYYMTTTGDEPNEPEASNQGPSQPAQSTSQLPGGGRTLGGGPPPPDYVASSSSSSQPPRRQQPQRGLRTLKDLQSAGNSGHSHGEDEEDDEHDTDFFAGGEKSGLAVQNPGQGRDPRDQINRILERARRNAERPGGDQEPVQTSRFRGSGVTLGGDDAPSRVIPDPRANVPAPAPRVHRQLHLWRNGFSVDDGPLYRYDDPANARTLEMINTGHAPLDILDVEQGQEVDVEVHAHKEEDYVQPKPKYKPFAGQGHRLGSPVPEASSAHAPPAPSSSAGPSSASASGPPTMNVDDAQPTVTLQIRLGDGTRLQSRFNTTHTIGDVYDFVTRASPASAQRSFALMTTFPSKELSEKGTALGDLPEFKRGGVIVQKWN